MKVPRMGTPLRWAAWIQLAGWGEGVWEKRRGYGNGDEMVGEVHEEVDRRPEVEGVVGRGGALTPQQTEQHQHRTTHPPDSRRACRDSAARATHSHTPHAPTMWSSRMARRRRVVRHAFSPTSYRHRSSSESIAPSHSAGCYVSHHYTTTTTSLPSFAPLVSSASASLTSAVYRRLRTEHAAGARPLQAPNRQP